MKPIRTIRNSSRYSKWSTLTLCAITIALAILSCNLPGTQPEVGTTPTPGVPSQDGGAILLPTQLPTLTSTPFPTPIPAVRIETGERAYLNGEWDRAQQEYQAASLASSEPEMQAAALLGIGRTAYQAGDYASAEKTLSQLIQEYPQTAHLPYAYFTLGQTYTALQRYSEAADAYLNYIALRSGLVDAYILNLRGDSLQAAGNYVEAANDYRAALQAPSFLDSLNLEIKLARTHALAGDYQTAIAMYDDIFTRASSDATKAQMDYFKGLAYTSLGDQASAQAAYLDAVTNFPSAYDSYLALVALVDAGVPVSELDRGIVDTFAGQYGAAVAAFDRYFQSNPANPATGLYYNGLALRASGRHEQAIEQWDKLIRDYKDDRFWDDAWEQKAYTQWAYLEKYEPAVNTLLDFVASAPGHPRAAEFLNDAASTAERDGSLIQAAEIWERLANEYTVSEYTPRALFQAGISRYRKGDTANALAIFSRALGSAVSLEERAAAYFWQAKCQEAQGEHDAAQATWEQAAAIDPTGYYSERARDLLRSLPPFSPPDTYDLVVSASTERQEAENWIRTTFALPEDTDLASPASLVSDPRFQRGTELWQLGLLDEARLEFENFRTAIQDNPADSYRLANYLFELGVYRSAILSARQVLNLAGLDDATSLSAPIYFNHLRFGAYYADLVIPTAQQYNFHPLLIFSVIRQESAFEGFVRSSAGARGLMQIIPATGEEIAQRLGWPADYSTDDLYRPQVSIVMGTEYLARWRDYFEGDLYAALAAYNGGPGNAGVWKELSNGDPDLFLEVVRYEETRNYIRGVYEIFNLYRRIYNRTP